MKANNELVFRQQSPGEEIPWALLLEADPSRELVMEYLESGVLWRLERDQQLIGVYVLKNLGDGVAEVMNISVAEDMQGHGYGALLLQHAAQEANRHGLQSLRICTADASVRQQAIYEKAGFKKVGVVSDYFIKHYPEPLFDQGQECRNQIVMERLICPKKT